MGVLHCYLPAPVIKASFPFRFSCPQVASDNYNECVMFNLPCTDIFSGKLNVFRYYQTITSTS